MIDRRTFLGTTVCGATASLAAGSLLRAADRPAGVTFSFGTYGMKSMGTEDAIRAVAEVGYDGIELAVRPDWDCAPGKMSKPRRDAMRGLLADGGLQVTALMEHLYPEQDDEKHQASLDRLLGVAELGYDLSPDKRPLIQTVLGGGTWEEKKHFFVDRLGDWARIAEQAETVIAIKPHRGGGMSQPSEAAWLIQQLGNTHWIRMVYDYSHYAFRDLTVEETVQTALPYTAHIAIKDAVKTDTGFRFVLPGQSGDFDYAELFRLFYAGGYRGDICCEVSGMVWSQEGYEPVAAAKRCYANIAPAFIAAKVPRRGGGS
jgi:inosose dehydratase